MALLTLNDEIVKLGTHFLQDKGLPAKATDDAYHIAYATVHQINYLFTWNCKHIANVQIQNKLRQISAKEGYYQFFVRLMNCYRRVSNVERPNYCRTSPNPRSPCQTI